MGDDSKDTSFRQGFQDSKSVISGTFGKSAGTLEREHPILAQILYGPADLREVDSNVRVNALSAAVSPFLYLQRAISATLEHGTKTKGRMRETEFLQQIDEAVATPELREVIENAKPSPTQMHLAEKTLGGIGVRDKITVQKLAKILAVGERDSEAVISLKTLQPLLKM